jgi:outer membrane protein OmpA-like peptidoglycan-associated protein
MAGVAGPAGRPGPAGPQGSVGPEGAQGPAGVVDRWISFRDFTFAYGSAEIQSFDAPKVSETVAYMEQNPSLQVGIDGSMDPRGTDPRNQDLSDRRIAAIRNALIQAGVPAYRIQTGAFGDPGLTRDRRVEVLVRTSN